MERTYLDWNATAPLRREARDAMIAAMDVVGNPSSVHAEGRAAKALVERARGQVASLVGIDRNEVVFTSGATEAAALACAGHEVAAAGFEHDAVSAHMTSDLPVLPNGEVAPFKAVPGSLLAMQGANSETGVLQDNFRWAQVAWASGAMVLVDAVQLAGKVRTSVDVLGADYLMLSAHKLGGPKGVGALCLKLGVDVQAQITGGGQEQGRRSGTENVIGIAGFGAACAAAERDLEAGVWARVEKLRNILENAIAASADQTIFVGKDAPRLPNTSCFATPGWKGETQVMAMDLAGFAISAGSACSSGKVKASRVLRAMGYDEVTAASAVRVSLGPDTTEDEVMRFAEAWLRAHDRFRAKVA
ncbi:cysteine desulfurase family protein [Pseudaestuariivita atlantica]|uniref:Cysteine desulfurase n=1 Tax=Pseudaestuariivita atlantica TaxID=1317121 RepID=A0A0L1JTX2_9RHOB|nr:cysteine desulfurase family protein [Pseudaestuariivita atlantica]KNG95224.1 aminotransferase [Pseudaestuariivita atlantica]